MGLTVTQRESRVTGGGSGRLITLGVEALLVNSNTMSLTLNRRAIFGAGIAVPVLALMFMAYLASAETAPMVSTVIRSTSGATTTSAAIGAVVHADVHVSSTTVPIATSTVDFSVYPNETCADTPTFQNNVPLVNGFATSSTSTVGVAGLSYKVHYDGETGVHAPADGDCTAVIATGPNTSIQTTLSTTSIAVLSSVYDTAVLRGHTLHASGTVAYTVYSNSGCLSGARSAGIKSVTNGAIPNSDSLPFNTPGTFFWQAVYSGDSLNAGATSSCSSERLDVFATSTPPKPPKDDRCDFDDKDHDGDDGEDGEDGDDDCDNCNGNNGKHKGWFKNIHGFPLERGSVQKFIKSLPVSANVNVDVGSRDSDDDDEDDDEDDNDAKVKIRVSESDARNVEWRIRHRDD